MAHENDQVFFNVGCGKCGQSLSRVDGGVYKHDNDADCDAGNVEMPTVTPLLLARLLGSKPPIKAKAAKKTSKK